MVLNGHLSCLIHFLSEFSSFIWYLRVVFLETTTKQTRLIPFGWIKIRKNLEFGIGNSWNHFVNRPYGKYILCIRFTLMECHQFFLITKFMGEVETYPSTQTVLFSFISSFFGLLIHAQIKIGTSQANIDFFKGQLISKCPFGAFKLTKKTNKIFVRISALACHD